MLETYHQRKIKQWLKKNGWLVIKLRATDPPSFPDLLALKNGKAWFIEVKRPGEQPTKLQLKKHEQLKKQGFKVSVWSDPPKVKEFTVEDWDMWFPNLSSSKRSEIK